MFYAYLEQIKQYKICDQIKIKQFIERFVKWEKNT